MFSPKAMNEFKAIGWCLIIFFGFHIPWNLFEAIRHTYMDGWTDHARSHFIHFAFMAVLVLPIKQCLWELIWNKWQEARGNE